MSARIALERFGTVEPDDDSALEAGDMPVPEHEGECRAGSPENEIDPEAERAACLARIANALKIAASEQAALRARCIEDTSNAFGAAAASVLPQLARAGFATQIAEAVQIIARRGQWPALLVSVAPGDAAAVSGALANPGPGLGTELEVTADPALDPGEAQLTWSQGGAEIDVAAIAETALERFRLQLDGCLQQGGC